MEHFQAHPVMFGIFLSVASLIYLIVDGYRYLIMFQRFYHFRLHRNCRVGFSLTAKPINVV